MVFLRRTLWRKVLTSESHYTRSDSRSTVLCLSATRTLRPQLDTTTSEPSTCFSRGGSDCQSETCFYPRPSRSQEYKLLTRGELESCLCPSLWLADYRRPSPRNWSPSGASGWEKGKARSGASQRGKRFHSLTTSQPPCWKDWSPNNDDRRDHTVIWIA